MTKEIQAWYDRTDMKKLAVKSTMSNPYLTDPPDSFLPKGYESGADSLSDEVVPAVLEFQADP
jgi:hypothetical protein